MSANKDWILREQRETGNLKEDSRQKLIVGLCGFMKWFFEVESFTKPQKIMTATAAIQLFPQLQGQSESSGGIDILIGYMENRLKYLSSRKRKLDEHLEAIAPIENENHSALDEGALKNMVEQIQEALVSKDNLQLIENLSLTRSYRHQMFKNKRMEFIDSFPCFFVDVNIILIDYKDQYSDLETENEFVVNWSKYSEGLDTLIKTQYESTSFYTNWPEDIEQLLVLLKLLPASTLGKNKLAKPITFHKSTEKVIVYKKVYF